MGLAEQHDEGGMKLTIAWFEGTSREIRLLLGMGSPNPTETGAGEEIGQALIAAILAHNFERANRLKDQYLETHSVEEFKQLLEENDCEFCMGS